MRKCTEIEPLILGYVSGDILSSQKRVLDEHLKECENCLNEVMRLQKLDLSLMELKEEEPEAPEDLKSVILSEISAKKKKFDFHKKLFSSTTILSAATVVLAVLVFILIGKIELISTIPKAPKAREVKIMFFSSDAKDVSIVGDFNGWGAYPTHLMNVNNGMWEAKLKLAPGMYQYNLVVNGEKWIANPEAASYVPDGFGGTNSVVIVNDNGEKQVERVGEKI